MNDQELQKVKERVEKTIEMNENVMSALLEEMAKLKSEQQQLEEENRRWREHYESGSSIYKRNQRNPAR
ncbi:MAG TPA: hypothetical protein VFK37_06505 [Bacillales bacterium]|nr:hypothetical protein [Bacillales bacterium]HEU5138932.1 hypothetical protein [Bacillales bacterium]